MDRQLVRSDRDRVVGGVCGGLADYFGLDPVVVRLAWILFALFAGSGVLMYLVAWFVIPGADGRRIRLPLALIFLGFVLPALCFGCAMLATLPFGGFGR